MTREGNYATLRCAGTDQVKHNFCRRFYGYDHHHSDLNEICAALQSFYARGISGMLVQEFELVSAIFTGKGQVASAQRHNTKRQKTLVVMIQTTIISCIAPEL
jgi:hypothetical protein